jgi:hypothetical protein
MNILTKMYRSERDEALAVLAMLKFKKAKLRVHGDPDAHDKAVANLRKWLAELRRLHSLYGEIH